jgi:two-component system, chemotaxis family, protein-glutamate methylesterase/glutaminase
MAKKVYQKVVQIESPLRRGRRLSRDSGGSLDRSVENLIVIGTSAGGHQALRQVVRELSDDLPAAVLILLHMPPSSSREDGFRLEDWLRISTRLPIVRVKSGDRLQGGVISVAPPGMSVRLKEGILQVMEQDGRIVPLVTINTLFESAAQQYGHRVIGVILTGMLKDGTEGLKAVHEAGGITIVQDPTGAEYPDMPGSAMKDLPVTFCLQLRDIGATLDLLARRNTELETGLAVSVRLVKERVAFLARLMAQSRTNLVTFQFLSMEMAALQRDLSLLEGLVTKALVEHAAHQVAGKRP